MVYNIIISDKLHEDAINMLKEQRSLNIIDGSTDPDFDLNTEIENADALVVRSRTKVTRELIEKAKNLKIIARAGIGVDNIDIEASKEYKIPIINAPDASTETVADLTIGLLLCVIRNISYADRRIRKGNWKKSDLLGRDLSSLKMGIIGLGKIGRAVAKRASAFGMEIHAYDAYIPDEDIRKMGIIPQTLSNLLKTCDVISIHVPYNNETAGMLSEDMFKIMKNGSYLINVSRGGIVDETALLKAIKSKKIAGAAIDVFEVESGIHPLFQFDNVVVTPHIGASTVDAQRKVGIEIADKLIRFFIKKEKLKTVNGI